MFTLFDNRTQLTRDRREQGYNLDELNARIESDWARVIPEHHTLMLQHPEALVGI
jgi:hypothetical protein